MPTIGEVLIHALESRGVDVVFGIPGVHTVELYRGLAGSAVRHVTPRHEQGAGFMADGYARVTGRPGVCLLITGPGVTNAATALAQSYSDSVPVLAITSVNRTEELGRGLGRLHELPDQRGLTAGFTAFSHTLTRAGELGEVLDRAFAVFHGARPRPVHLEIPLDLLGAPGDESAAVPAPLPRRPAPGRGAVAEAAALLARARRPAVILGGGTVDAARSATALVERLDAPTALTIAAKGVLPASHPLCLGATLPLAPTQALLADADVVLAAGTELAETDTWRKGDPLPLSGKVVRLDVDPGQMARNARAHVPLVGDAAAGLRGLADAVAAQGPSGAEGTGREGVARVRSQLDGARRPQSARHLPWLEALRQALPPDAPITADSTQLVYTANECFPMERPRRWLTATTGFGTLGYAVPALVGAMLGAPERPGVALVGDGGLMFTLAELATAVEERLAAGVVVWNNRGYREIAEFMASRDIAPVGVDLHTPDLALLARAFGCRGARAAEPDALAEILPALTAEDRPMLIEIVDDSAPASV